MAASRLRTVVLMVMRARARARLADFLAHLHQRIPGFFPGDRIMAAGRAISALLQTGRCLEEGTAMAAMEPSSGKIAHGLLLGSDPAFVKNLRDEEDLRPLRLRPA